MGSENVYEGKWDFDGSCAPNEDGSGSAFYGQETFTLGCFQWVRRGRDGKGKGFKRGKVQKRIKGRVSDPATAYRQARAFCEDKNAE